MVRYNCQSSLDLGDDLSVAAESIPFQAALERSLDPPEGVVGATPFVTHHARMLARERIGNEESGMRNYHPFSLGNYEFRVSASLSGL